MSKSTTELSNKIAGKSLAPTGINDLLTKWKAVHFSKLVSLTGDSDAAERIFVICMNTIARNPELMMCTFDSLANCVLQSFQLGLFPGPFQECAYVPLRNNRAVPGKEVKEANFWIQYPGLIKLLRNAGNRAVVARVVCDGDVFQYREGDAAPIYQPACVVGRVRGEPRFAYAAVQTAQGYWQVEVMDMPQLLAIKSRSRGAGKSDSPWNSRYVDDQYAMMSKTVLKRVAKWCTKSADLVVALDSDNKVDGDPAIENIPTAALPSAVAVAALSDNSDMRSNAIVSFENGGTLEEIESAPNDQKDIEHSSSMLAD